MKNRDRKRKGGHDKIFHEFDPFSRIGILVISVMLDLKALGINAKTDKQYRLVGLQIHSNNNSGELAVP
jgi:hypothetical protein